MSWLLATLLTTASVTAAARLDDAAAEVDLVVRGTLRSAGDRAPIPSARLMAVPAAADEPLGVVSTDALLQPGIDPPEWVVSTESDASGTFVFESLASRRVRLVIIAEGHQRTEIIVDTADLPARGLTVFVSRDEEAEYRTVVEAPAKREAGHVTSTVLSEEEIRTAPGTQGDPLRALQNLPGVARSPGGLGILVLRGASPNQSRVFLGGHAGQSPVDLGPVWDRAGEIVHDRSRPFRAGHVSCCPVEYPQYVRRSGQAVDPHVVHVFSAEVDPFSVRRIVIGVRLFVSFGTCCFD